MIRPFLLRATGAYALARPTWGRGWATAAYAVQPRRRASTLPSFAQVLKYEKHGDPKTVLRLEREALPAVLGANDVMVRVLAAPFNPADINMIEGTYALLPPLPAVGGNECVGVVEHVGSAVGALKCGDWVVPQTSGMGTWRDFIVAEAGMFHRVPNDIPVEAAATLTVNPPTAWRMLSDFVALKAGDLVVQNAATSAVGLAVIQMAAAKGVRTINIIRKRPDMDETVGLLKSLGADHVVDEGFACGAEMKQLLKTTGKARLGLNCTGGPVATEVARTLARGGTMVTYGGMSRKPVTIPTGLFIFSDIQLRGFWMTQWYKEHSVEEKSEMFDAITALIKAGTLKTHAHPVPMARFADALDGKFRKKVLFTMGEN